MCVVSAVYRENTRFIMISGVPSRGSGNPGLTGKRFLFGRVDFYKKDFRVKNMASGVFMLTSYKINSYVCVISIQCLGPV